MCTLAGVSRASYYRRWRRVAPRREQTELRDADTLLKKRLGEISQGLPPSVDADKVTFTDLAHLIREDYAQQGRRSTRRMTIAVARLEEKFGHWRAVEIGAGIDDYITARLAVVKPATVAAELAALRRMFTLAVQKKRLTPAHRPYVPTLTLHNARKGFFERPDFERALAALPAHVASIIEFGYHTGWRVPSEVQTLKWPQIDFHAGEVRLEPGTVTKNAEGRSIPSWAICSAGSGRG